MASALKPRGAGVEIVTTGDSGRGNCVTARASTTRINPTTESFRRELLSKLAAAFGLVVDRAPGPSSAPRACNHQPCNGDPTGHCRCVPGRSATTTHAGGGRRRRGSSRAEASGADPRGTHAPLQPSASRCFQPRRSSLRRWLREVNFTRSRHSDFSRKGRVLRKKTLNPGSGRCQQMFLRTASAFALSRVKRIIYRNKLQRLSRGNYTRAWD